MEPQLKTQWFDGHFHMNLVTPSDSFSPFVLQLCILQQHTEAITSFLMSSQHVFNEYNYYCFTAIIQDKLL